MSDRKIKILFLIKQWHPDIWGDIELNNAVTRLLVRILLSYR
jgi:hypothetical protein